MKTKFLVIFIFLFIFSGVNAQETVVSNYRLYTDSLTIINGDTVVFTDTLFGNVFSNNSRLLVKGPSIRINRLFNAGSFADGGAVIAYSAYERMIVSQIVNPIDTLLFGSVNVNISSGLPPYTLSFFNQDRPDSLDSLYIDFSMTSGYIDSLLTLYPDTVLANCLSGNYRYSANDQYTNISPNVFVGEKMKESRFNVSINSSGEYVSATSGWAKSGVIKDDVCDLEKGKGHLGTNLLGKGEEILLGFSANNQLAGSDSALVFGVYINKNKIHVIVDSIKRKTYDYSPNDNLAFVYGDQKISLLLNNNRITTFSTTHSQLYFVCTAVSQGPFLSSVLVAPELELLYDVVHLSNTGSNDGQIDLHAGVTATWPDLGMSGDLAGLSSGSYNGQITSSSSVTAAENIKVGYYTQWFVNNFETTSSGGLNVINPQERSKALSVYDSGEATDFWCECAYDLTQSTTPNAFYGVVGVNLDDNSVNGFYLSKVGGVRAIVPIRNGRKAPRENVVFVGNNNHLVLRLERNGNSLVYKANGSQIYAENLIYGQNYRMVSFANSYDHILEYSASSFDHLRTKELEMKQQYISCELQTAATLEAYFPDIDIPANSDSYHCSLINEDTGDEYFSTGYEFTFVDQPVSLYHAFVETEYSTIWTQDVLEHSDTVYSFVGNLPDGTNLIENLPAYYNPVDGLLTNPELNQSYFAFSNNLFPYEDGWIAVRYSPDYQNNTWGFNDELNGNVLYGYRMLGSSHSISLLYNNEVLPGISVKWGDKDRLSVERSGNIISYFKNDSLIFETECQPNRELFLNGSITKGGQLKLGMSFCPRCNLAVSPGQNITLYPGNEAHLTFTGVEYVSWDPEPDNGISCLDCLTPVITSEISPEPYTIWGYRSGESRYCDELEITIQIGSSTGDSQPDDLEFGCNFINVGTFINTGENICVFGNFINETGTYDQNLVCQGRILNTDSICVTGNWTNNCQSNVFVSESGNVDLIGSEQFIKGLYPTKFNNLTLNDWDHIATSGRKVLLNNQAITRSVNLNTSELACNDYTLEVTSDLYNDAILFDEGGFVSTEGDNAFLSWLVNAETVQLFPLGENAGCFLFRPVSVNSDQLQYVKVQFIPENPADLGYTGLASDIYDINDSFFHRVYKSQEDAAIDLKVYYNQTLDGDFHQLAYWNSTDQGIWNSHSPATLETVTGVSFTDKSVVREHVSYNHDPEIVLANVGLVINAEDFDNSEDEDEDGIADEFDSDDDGDGIPDECDVDSYPEGMYEDANHNGIISECDAEEQVQQYPDTGNDDDGDGIPDECDSFDNTNGIAYSGANDLDGDGIENSCDDDIDGDGLLNTEDPDDDGDNIWDIYDSDPQGAGEDITLPDSDECDTDNNNNNIPDCCDALLLTGVDTDSDGILNFCDTDIDGDGILNIYDDDQDGDGIDDGTCDADADGDGVLDEGIENTEDANENLILDACEEEYVVDPGDINIDGDDVEDDCDSNTDGIPLVVSDVDIDANGILDSCEDWDGDGIANAYDLDDDNDGIPDDCDSDNNNDGNVDFGQNDADNDGINDESDADANGDGILDEGCSDENENGVNDAEEQLYGDQGSGNSSGTSFVLTYTGGNTGNIGTTYSSDQGDVLYYPLQEGNYILDFITDELCSTSGRVLFSVDGTGVVYDIVYVDVDNLPIEGEELLLSPDLYNLPEELQGIIMKARPPEQEFDLNYSVSLGESNPLILENGEDIILEFENYEHIDNMTINFYNGSPESGSLLFVKNPTLSDLITISDIYTDFQSAGMASGVCYMLIIIEQGSEETILKSQFIVNIE